MINSLIYDAMSKLKVISIAIRNICDIFHKYSFQILDHQTSDN